ncbi:MAG: hypothetical protein OEU26_22345, partial [Candidatus Tectomicrobia bacterium]|nr:hypothetical protein [Candidatus Tectomicrobia bacterium]
MATLLPLAYYRVSDSPRREMNGGRAAAETENAMPPCAEVCFEVPFHDVDMMGVVWHGHYYKYFELA